MTRSFALTGARIFDGESWHDDAALLVRDDAIEGIVADRATIGIEKIALEGGMLVPGFVDLQVNGGGGVLLNEEPTVDAIETICSTFARFGSTGLLPTLITDTREVTAHTVAAGLAATRRKIPGFLGLHLEGPHLSIARKGAHDPALIRPMEEADIEALIAARAGLPNLLTTVAAETVTPAQISRLVQAGIIVSLGHSDASIAVASSAVAAGATMATHLFNAMSPLSHREPGLVGAVLDSPELFAGIIADGIHVAPATLGIALRAKREPGRIFLVSDAMSMTGTDLKTITLNGRLITRSGGALRLTDGTLAGADLTMVDAMAFIHRTIGLPLTEALRMASLYPARALGIAARKGHLKNGALADIVHLSGELRVKSTWIGGAQVFEA